VKRIVEVDRRPEAARRADARDELHDRQTTERRLYWEQGFAAAMELVAANNDPARRTRDLELRELQVLQDLQDLPTAPYPIVDVDLIESD
jgi:hypothetical protein